MRSIAFVVVVWFYASLSLAWSWPANTPGRDLGRELLPRDDATTSTAEPASSAQPETASNTGSAPTATSGDSQQSGSAAPSSQPTGKPDNSHNSNATATSSISIDPRSPAGGISMINPAPTVTTYYKFGNNITWAWNYTSLIVTPQAVNVLVSCQDTASTFTIAQNVSVNATQSVIWDTSEETGADITDKYTLVIYDAGNPAGVSATPQPGRLSVYNQFTFGMYTPQAYTPLGQGYMCVTCNGAMTSTERQAIGMMATMALITVASFTYFASGFLAM